MFLEQLYRCFNDSIDAGAARRSLAELFPFGKQLILKGLESMGLGICDQTVRFDRRWFFFGFPSEPRQSLFFHE
ncbi:hypothetical protein [Sphingobium vermicomposti]|uniref:Uncharacterized protein n=1 Tax=Sphingobium vermicomposti TaxID=529005 RepID=A0A846M8N9_9SPHN|nr:hypothetical protein [Sphingobium vermicomposti]NIJ17823.1 hypothetical protein [Sphingobium vermicomposti]